jgi:hypothetical protein
MATKIKLRIDMPMIGMLMIGMPNLGGEVLNQTVMKKPVNMRRHDAAIEKSKCLLRNDIIPLASPNAKAMMKKNASTRTPRITSLIE